jgi:hypothetical protein
VKSKCKTKTKHNEKPKKHELKRKKNLLGLYPFPFVVSLSGGATLNPKAFNPKPKSNLPINPPKP